MSDAHFVLSTLSPGVGQRRRVFALALLMICGCLLAMPLAGTYSSRFDALLLVADAVLVTTSGIAALLLYMQFRVTRAPALLALASGFLFVALSTLPQMLRISQGLYFNPRLLFVTELALPIAVIGYTLLLHARRDDGSPDFAARIARAIVATAGIAALVLWLTAFNGTSLLAEAGAGAANTRVMGTVVLLSVTAVAMVMLWRRCHSQLDLWLLLALTAWLLGVLLQGLSASGANLGWPIASLFALMGTSCLLLALLQARDARRPDTRALKAISDELNQPLFAITANADAAMRLLNRNPPDLLEARAALADIANDAQRVSRLMDGAQRLLAASPEPPAVIDIGELVHDCMVHLRPELFAHQVACDVETAPHLPGIRGVRRQLMQMLLDLVSHSLEAMASMNSRERRLTLRTRQPDARTVEISVVDSGVGKPQPNSLGLAVCRSIVDAHGGNMLVVPGESGGTAFKVILPVSS